MVTPSPNTPPQKNDKQVRNELKFPVPKTKRMITNTHQYSNHHRRILDLTGRILDRGDKVAFFGAHFLKKRVFCLLAPPKQILFSIISNKNQGTRLGAIVAPYKGLE